MNDLISRQAAIDLWEQYNPYIATKACEYDTMLRQLPSAEPERKKGKWKVVPYKSVQHGEVVIDGETVRCSECRHAGKGWHSGMRFCPNCGSYNGGEQDE